MTYLFTSESVSEGHPDKICDRISDAIVDLYLGKFAEARVACETLVTKNLTVLAGETRCPEAVSRDEIIATARKAVKAIGYEQENYHWAHMAVESYLHSQSADIAQGVDSTDSKEEGAGDQGIMFGFACSETEVLMPAPIHYAHRILKMLAERRQGDPSTILGPDSKAQITCRYEGGVPVRAESIVVSTQHRNDASQQAVRDLVRQCVAATLPDGWMCDEDKLYVNPTGRFVIGGPDGDAGLTGRKIIVDTYGGAAPHGGGAFSGKDPTKVDRSAAYAARYLAKNIVASGLAEKCTIQLSYAIGLAYPLSVFVDTHGTGTVADSILEQIVPTVMDLSPQRIREHLRLNAAIYTPTAAYGHFGRMPDEAGVGTFPWEAVDLAQTLLAEAERFA